MLIKIDSVEDLFNLDLALRDWSEYDFDCYFGIVITNDMDGKLICIKDNYD